jgi:hypothetical protein
MRNTGNNAAPSVVFQSGDPEYGSDNSRDFRIFASNNQFRLDSQSQTSLYTVLDVSSNNHIGIGSNYDENYDVYLYGKVNIGESIFLNNVPLFSSGGAQNTDGATLTSRNIYINPEVSPDYNGAIVVNGLTPTGNLFTINSGYNANMMVLDSALQQAQVHFRTLTNGVYNMYRMETSNTTFEWKFYGNSFDDLTVPDTDEGYSNVMNVQPTNRTGAIQRQEFDFNVYGALVSTSTVNPVVHLGSMGSVGGSNGSLYMNTGSNGVGIGTYTPRAGLHVFSSNASLPALRVDQSSKSSTGNLISAFNGSTCNVFAVSTTGAILGNSMYLEDGSATYPAYGFRYASNTGMFKAKTNDIGFATNCNECMRITSDGRVGVGSNVPMGVFSVSANSSNSVLTSSSVPLFVAYQPGVADAMRIMNNAAQTKVVVTSSGAMGIGTSVPRSGYDLNVQGVFGMTGHILPTSNVAYDLGSDTLRWRDIYLSGDTINLGGTKISKNAITGRVSFTSNQTSQGIDVSDITIGSNANRITITSSGSNLSFGTTIGTFFPLLTDPKTSSVSIGGNSSFTSVSDNAALNVYASNSDTTGYTAVPGAIINQCSTPFNGSSNNDILRLLANNSNVLTVQQNGYVGIGTTAPNAVLDVRQSSPTSNVATFYATYAGVYPQVVINSAGYVGIGTTTPSSNLHVHGSVLVDGYSTFGANVNMNGNLYVYGNSYVQGNQTAGVMTANSSDKRLKKDFEKIEHGLEKIQRLTGYTYVRMDSNDSRRYTGLIAQEVQEVLPEAVLVDESSYLSVAYGNMLGLVVEAIKELSTQVASLASEVYKTQNNDV